MFKRTVRYGRPGTDVTFSIKHYIQCVCVRVYYQVVRQHGTFRNMCTTIKRYF